MEQLRKSSEHDARALYARLIAAWNARDGAAFAACFAADGSLVGFDGSVVSGRDAIERHLTEIFAHHQTPAYVTRVSEVRMLTATAQLLQSFAGLVPPKQSDINSALTAVQAMTAVYRDGPWQIAHFQNTPAQF